VSLRRLVYHPSGRLARGVINARGALSVHLSPITSHHLPLGAFPAMSALSALTALKEQKVTLLFVIARLVSSCLLRLAFEQVEEAS
jgi:hypothetical protein